MLKVFIEEEYGYNYHSWNFPGTQDELIAEWKAGRVPRGIGFVGCRDFLGTVEVANVPDIDVDGMTDEEYDAREEELVAELSRMWQVMLDKYDVCGHLHEPDDSYLMFRDGTKLKWEADIDHDIIVQDILQKVLGE